jgi:hypothetical protein
MSEKLPKMLPGPGNMAITQQTKKGQQKMTRMPQISIYLKSYFKEKLTNALVPVQMNDLWCVLSPYF